MRELYNLILNANIVYINDILVKSRFTTEYIVYNYDISKIIKYEIVQNNNGVVHIKTFDDVKFEYNEFEFESDQQESAVQNLIKTFQILGKYLQYLSGNLKYTNSDIDEMIKYFESTESYEICAKLKQLYKN